MGSENCSEPKPMINNVQASATKTDSDLIKPEPLKARLNNNNEGERERKYYNSTCCHQ